MKFTEKGIKDGWNNTTEDSKEFLKNEIFWEIRNGQYEDVDEVIKDFSDYIEEFTADEINLMEDAIDDRLNELEDIREREAEQDELDAREYTAMISELNHYYYSTRI